jgi:hypothetical protein
MTRYRHAATGTVLDGNVRRRLLEIARNPGAVFEREGRERGRGAEGKVYLYLSLSEPFGTLSGAAALETAGAVGARRLIDEFPLVRGVLEREDGACLPADGAGRYVEEDVLDSFEGPGRLLLDAKKLLSPDAFVDRALVSMCETEDIENLDYLLLYIFDRDEWEMSCDLEIPPCSEKTADFLRNYGERNIRKYRLVFPAIRDDERSFDVARTFNALSMTGVLYAGERERKRTGSSYSSIFLRNLADAAGWAAIDDRFELSKGRFVELASGYLEVDIPLDGLGGLAARRETLEKVRGVVLLSEMVGKAEDILSGAGFVEVKEFLSALEPVEETDTAASSM